MGGCAPRTGNSALRLCQGRLDRFLLLSGRSFSHRLPWIFLPVRLITADFADQKGPLQNVMLIDNETWLPRTQSLLNEVNQEHIPAGFTQVAPPQ